VLGVFHLLKRRHPDMVTVGASVYIESAFRSTKE
jgi:hypothetical protein